jgi:hypothetical protein
VSFESFVELLLIRLSYTVSEQKYNRLKKEGPPELGSTAVLLVSATELSTTFTLTLRDGRISTTTVTALEGKEKEIPPSFILPL